MSITNAQILKAVEGVGEKVDTLNGRVRGNETAIATLTQWKVGQDKVSEGLADDVKGLRNKQNIFTALLATCQLVVAAVLKGGVE